MGKKKKSGAAHATVGDRPFLHIGVRAFCHATEEPERVLEALAFAASLPRDTPEGQAAFTKLLKDTQTEGHYHNPIHIYELDLARNADIRRFWSALLSDDTVRRRLADEADPRLDDDLVFWIRFDKQAAARAQCRLSDGQDVIQVRAKLATYPKDRDVGLRFLRNFLTAS